jgi:hypothetical protein
VFPQVAEEKGLLGIGGTAGIPVKRNRLPSPPELLDEGCLEAVTRRHAASSGRKGWRLLDSRWLCCGDDIVAEIDGAEDAAFIAAAPADIEALLAENAVLRAWVRRVVDRACKTTRRS